MANLLELLVALNPWWSGRDFDTGVRRDRYLSKIKRYCAAREIVVLSGVGRSGRTALLYRTNLNLIDEQSVDPRSILFVNYGEPALARPDRPLEQVLDSYRSNVWSGEGAWFVFDEIRASPGRERWLNYSLKVQARNNRKVYCLDTGLRNAVSFTFSADEERCAGNLVFLELRRREIGVGGMVMAPPSSKSSWTKRHAFKAGEKMTD